jgi:hypothetical protein
VRQSSLVLFFIASALTAQVRTPAQSQPDTSPTETKPEDRCVLQGRITDAITGEPVKNANVQLHRRAPNPSPSGYSSTSEKDGTALTSSQTSSLDITTWQSAAAATRIRRITRP